MTKKEFLKQPECKKCAGNINGAAITLYICAGLSLVLNVLASNILGLLDVLVIVGLALGIHLAQSRVCAILVLAYAIYNTIYMIVATGKVGGYLIIIAAVYGVMATFQFQKAWKNYQQNGM